LSAEQDKVRSIAERIASRLGGDAARGELSTRDRNDAGGDEVTQLRDALREMQQRLAQIESRVGRGGESQQSAAQIESVGVAQSQARDESQSRAPRQLLSSTYVPATHPSQERFAIDDAVTELVDFFEKEKVCSVEPGNKPCDHCALCSTRGF
jgi:small-conductance mechanosensitive channel